MLKTSKDKVSETRELLSEAIIHDEKNDNENYSHFELSNYEEVNSQRNLEDIRDEYENELSHQQDSSAVLLSKHGLLKNVSNDDITNRITQCSDSLDSFYSILRQLPGIKSNSSDRIYRSEDVIQACQNVANKLASENCITNAYGIRRKFLSIMESRKSTAIDSSNMQEFIVHCPMDRQEFYAILKRYSGSIESKSTDAVFTPDELINLCENVANGTLKLEFITSTYKIREKFSAILNLEKKHAAENEPSKQLIGKK